MIKQNWNDKEVMVMDKNDILWLLHTSNPNMKASMNCIILVER